MRLYIIGNGFDLEHKLPTSFEEDFKEIAEKNETFEGFWDCYTDKGEGIWADFENSLANPDFNEMFNYLEDYYPDYSSERESDRDSVVHVAHDSGNLNSSIYEFANAAENSLENAIAKDELIDTFTSNDLFINFNYTHTLQRLYNISSKNVCHIHGEVGGEEDNLIIGYPKGYYEAEDYYHDVRMKGRGPYSIINMEEYLKQDNGIDLYMHSAYTILLNKSKTFSKETQYEAINSFLSGTEIEEIIVRGHSCMIDFPYFVLLKEKYPNAEWIIYYFDDKDKKNKEKFLHDYGITNHEFVPLNS